MGIEEEMSEMIRKGHFRLTFIEIAIGAGIIYAIHGFTGSSKKVVYPTEYATELVKGSLDTLHIDGFEFRPGTTKWSEIKSFFGKASREEQEKDGTFKRIYGDDNGAHNRMVLEFEDSSKDAILELAYVEYSDSVENIYVADELTVTGAKISTFADLYPEAESVFMMGYQEYQSESGIANTITFSTGPLSSDLCAICVLLNDPNGEKWHIQ